MSALKPFLTNIANAIREKKETNAPINARDFANEILSIEGGGQKPTLNTPEISLNANGGYLNVTDYRNGDFTQEYRLYLNGIESKTFPAIPKTVLLTELGVSETDEITVQAVGNLFNSSALSNMTKWDNLSDGTIGVVYSGNSLTGTIKNVATDVTEIYVASIVNGIVITTANDGIGEIVDRKVILPDSITFTESYCFPYTKNSTIVYGANFNSLGLENFRKSTDGVVLDFSKVQQIPTCGKWASTTSIKKVIVPDRFYDEWIIATNWTKWGSRTVRVSEHEAQQGGAV